MIQCMLLMIMKACFDVNYYALKFFLSKTIAYLGQLFDKKYPFGPLILVPAFIKLQVEHLEWSHAEIP